MATFRTDPKTGRKRRVNPRLSKIAKNAARHRRKKRPSAATKMKIAKGVRKAHRTGRTTTGRKSKF
jgi:hypothetical protein